MDSHEFHHIIRKSSLDPSAVRAIVKLPQWQHSFWYIMKQYQRSPDNQPMLQWHFFLFKPNEVEKSLHTSMVQYQHYMKDNLSLASRVVKNKCNFISSAKKLSRCFHCGFVWTKLCHVRHCRKSKSTSYSANGYGFLIPLVILDKIAIDIFILPIKSGIHTDSVPRWLSGRCPESGLPLILW